jgi:hypothetical protein
MTLPSTLDPGSFIIPLGVSSPTLKAGPLPTGVISYLDSFATVQEQFNGIPLTLCAPALPVRTACTTVLTSTSTTVSCSSIIGVEQSCVTLVETITETNTHTPHWPTLNGSFADLKQTAARLTTETREAITLQATAEPVLEPASGEATDATDQSSDSGAQASTSVTAEVSEASAEDSLGSSTAQTVANSPILTATAINPSEVRSGTVSNIQASSPATGSPASESSAATFTGAGLGVLTTCWTLLLTAALAGSLS